MANGLENVITTITEIMKSVGPLAGFFLIILESIIPVLPLAAFIALNNIAFGSFWGFVISWVATIIGCLISFYAFRLGFSKVLYKNIKNEGKVHRFMDYVSKISLPKLTILVALPFTPAFVINIASGLSKMNTKYYLISLFIGKLSIVYFWGYIGTSFFESIKKPSILFGIAVLLLLTYVISRLIQKYLKMNEVK